MYVNKLIPNPQLACDLFNFKHDKLPSQCV